MNSIGSVHLPGSTVFHAWPYEIDGEFGGARPTSPAPMIDPAPADSRLADMHAPEHGTSTVIAIVATSAALNSADCHRVAVMAQDGIARAVRPSHTPFDGDTVFAVATGTAADGRPADPTLVARIGSAAADCLARAIARGVHEATRG